MDYSIYDAIESGFTKVVFLIKRDMLETIENAIAKRIKNKIVWIIKTNSLDFNSFITKQSEYKYWNN